MSRYTHHVGDAVYHPREGWGGRVVGVHSGEKGPEYTVRLGESGWEDDNPSWQPDRHTAPYGPNQERRVRDGSVVKSPFLSERHQSPGYH